MRLNHLSRCVPDLAEARAFVERHVDFRLVEQKGQAIAILSDGHGFVLVLSDSARFGGETPPRYPVAFHVGFILETPDEVDAGVPLDQRPRRQHGDYGFYFTALGTIRFEVAAPVQAEPANGEHPASRPG